MSKQIDPRDIKWFGPIWRRIALVVAVVIWSGLEWYNGDQFWGMMTLAVVAYAVWKLFIDFPSADEIAAFENAEAAKATQPAAAPAKDDDVSA